MQTLDQKKNFLGLDKEWSSFRTSHIVIQSVPYEYTSSYIRGSVNGPSQILKASHFVEFYDEELEKEVYKETGGIATIRPYSFIGKRDESAIRYIAESTHALLEGGKFVVSLGAEHTVTLGLYRAFAKRNKNFSVLQIDAHSDLRKSYQNNPYSHACVMARCHEEGATITQVGIRAQCIEENEYMLRSTRIHTFYMHDLRKGKDWMSCAIDTLKQNVYITVDADGFDPSVIAAVGTPEPNGLLWGETLTFLRKVSREKKIVGFDVVELCPRKGDIVSEYTLAKLIYRLIGYIFCR